jgi:hypothetical protein
MTVGPSGVIVRRKPGDGSRRRRGDLFRAGRTAWTTGLCLLPLGLLAAASWLGRHVRPGADDWCFLPSVRDHGISGLISKFYVTDNGRLGNGLLVGLYAKFPVAGHQWFGLISGVLVLVVLWSVTVQVLRRSGWTAPRGVPLLVASMIMAVFLFATPNTYKTFYWPAASVSHTMAPVLACAAAVPLLRARSRRGRITALAVVLGTGTFLGTLSEETSVVALVVLSGVVLLGHWIFTARARAFVRGWSLTGMAGIGIGTIVLVTSPGSRNRRRRYGADSLLAPESLIASLRGYARILETIFTTWQYVGAVAAGVLLGLSALRTSGTSAVMLPCRPLLLVCSGAFAFLVSGYLCTVITYPVFGARVVAAERTWNDYLLLYAVLLVGVGVLLGRVLRRYGQWTGTATATAVCAAAVLGLVAPLHHLAQDMQVRAHRWDQQDRWLRARAADGAKVLPYRPVSISGMLEPFGGKGREWPARCVADYYHLDRVTYSDRLP